MSKRLLLCACLLLMTSPAWACELGSVCWTDLSKGTAQTELRFRADGFDKTVTVGKGHTSFAFTDLVRGAAAFESDWLCVYGRQRADDGRVSAWYISDKEGICHDPEQVLPPMVIVPPPIVEPPPPVPPPPAPPAQDIFTGVTNRNGLLSFSYRLAECPRGVQQTTRTDRNGQKTITLRCRK